jgi:xanthine dehydrogenase YagR molybdenum-binding subunit
MTLMSKVIETVAKVLPDRSSHPIAGSHRHVGRPIDRLDGPDKVAGAAKFAAEYRPEGMVYAALVYSTIAKGRIESIDVSEAGAMPGVLSVITHDNAPAMKPPPLMDASGGSSDSAGSSVNVLNTADVSWNGQPIAIVVADTQERADRAALRIKASYTEMRAETSFENARPQQKKPDNILGEEPELRKGDAESALAGAACRIDQRYETPFLNHNAIEPHAVTALWSGERLTLHTATQFVQGEASTIAKMFGLEADAVRVLSPFVGGGFGGKGATWAHVQLGVLAAKVVQRPVRLALSREGVFRIVGGRTRSEQRVALGADAEGRLISLIHTGMTANSPDNEWPEQFTFPARHLYAMQNYLISQTVTRLNMTANTAMRAPGESIGSFALESAIDELARELAVDPIELRFRNEPDRDPTKDTEFSGRHLKEAYQLGAEKFGWHEREKSRRDGEWLIGCGVATALYPFYRMPSAARVTIRADGTALVQTSAQEMGMGTSTAQTQHIADRLGLSMEQVTFEYGDSSLPPANMAGGSSQTASLALAIEQAFEKVKSELHSLARRGDDAALAHSDLDQIEVRDGGLYLKGESAIGERYSSILERAGKPFIAAEVKTGPPLEMMKYSMFSYGAQFCEVRVSERTGEVRVARWVAAFDTGRIVNPKTARSQFRGGVIMGIGMALMEETLVDERSGRIMNPSLAEYHVPVNADIPEIEVLFTDIPDPHAPLGVRGVGEIGIVGTAAAIANAIFDATGKRVRSLPITLDKLL